MSIVKATGQENLQTDIVVIGGGGAGLAAAATAAEKGIKNIVVLESRRVPGGNSVFPGGILGVETPLQRRLGVDATRDDVFRRAMEYAHWKPNARLIRALVDISGNNIRWLEEKGVEFVRLVAHYPNQVPLAYHAVGGNGRTGAAVIKALVKNCQDLGVRLLCLTPARKILTDEKGGVTGVLAAAKGKELKVSTKSVIIATGGFAGNKKLLKKYVPFYSDEIGLRGLPLKGDGLLMATEIGAATGGLITLEFEGPSFQWSGYLDVAAKRPNTIWVNKNAERFTDENAVSNNEAANAISEQPDKISYSIFDERIKQSIIEEALSPHEGRYMSSEVWRARIDKELQLQAGEGRIKIADSWDEIAKWMGTDPKVLKANIDEYNSFCDRGHDTLFVKDRRYLIPLRTPPYYAIRCQISLLVTHGGIKINHHLEVLDIQGKPIRGLYCAGDDTTGRMGDTYNILLSGLSFSFAIGSGRIAGEEAARYISGRK